MNKRLLLHISNHRGPIQLRCKSESFTILLQTVQAQYGKNL